MLRGLKSLFVKGAPHRGELKASLPEGERVYAIGDIHGRKDLLERMLGLIKADVAGYDGNITLITIGDYIDRGPDSKGVVDCLLRDIPAEWQRVYLRGNHEQALLDFMDNPLLRTEWLAWGGIQAIESYGVAPFGAKGLRDPQALLAEFVLALKDAGHENFFKETVLSYVIGDYAFVHAGVRRGIPIAKQMAEDLMFIREDFLGRPHDLPYRVVFGHTILEKPLVGDDRIGLDTGAFQSGVLTAVCLDAVSVRVLQAVEN